MTTDADELRDRFRGVLLGAMVGDALGMPLEGRSLRAIRREHGTFREMLPARLGRGTYTDDTEMALALAEALLDSPEPCRPDLNAVARRFGEAYRPERGYGGNTRRILAAIRAGEPWREAVSRRLLPGGSFANGAAMRVAPVALACHPDLASTGEAAELQAEPTGHVHPLGSYAARLQAVAVGLLLDRGPGVEPPGVGELRRVAGVDPPEEFDRALRWIEGHLDASPEEAAARLGTGSRASRSVPAALWSVLSRPEDPEEAIVRAVNLGGDADTIGAMAGAQAGARHGASALPRRWVESLEGGERGRDYALGLADRLFERRARAA